MAVVPIMTTMVEMIWNVNDESDYPLYDHRKCSHMGEILNNFYTSVSL